MKRIILSFAILLSMFTGFAGPKGDCGSAEYLLDDEYCNIFYKCVDGVAVAQECPSGLYFNAELMMCDWPSNVPCEGGGHNHAACVQGDDGNCVHRACSVSGCNLLVNICEPTSGTPICAVH